MKITVTCVSAEENGRILGDVCVWLEELLVANLGDNFSDPHCDQFVIVFVSVEEDPEKNKKFAKGNDKGGVYTHFQTKKRIRHVSIAVLLDPRHTMEFESAKHLALNSLIDRLASPFYGVPKDTDFKKMLHLLSEALLKIKSNLD